MEKLPPLKTLLETAIEKRNLYQGRLIERMVNIPYFLKQVELTKPDTQERVNAKADLEKAKLDLRDDEILMVCFDELIANLKKKEK